MKRRDFTAVLAVLALCNGQADAQTNNGAVVVAENGIQSNAQVISDGAGGAFVVWIDGRGAALDIYAQYMGASGAPRWQRGGIPVCTAPGYQHMPRLVSDGAGGIIIAWTDSRSGVDKIFAQRINAQGNALWTHDGVPLCTATGSQSALSMCSDGAQGAIVSWVDMRNGSADIFAQRVSGAGVPAWAVSGVEVCLSANWQALPLVVSDGAYGAFIAWLDARSGIADIYAQRIGSNGQALWTTNGLPVSTATGTQEALKGISDDAGGAVLVWEDYRNGTSHIYSQRLNGNGVPLWTLNGVALCTTAQAATAPEICTDGQNGAIVAWSDRRQDYGDIYAQRVSAAGLPQWTTNGVPVGAAGGEQISHGVVENGTGGAWLAWRDGSRGDFDIYAQQLNADGAPMLARDGVPVCRRQGLQDDPGLARSGNHVVAVWEDHRYGSAPDLFAQGLSAMGAPAFSDAEVPTLLSVRDVPNDQGGRVKLSWSGSILDPAPFAEIATYWIWRSAPPQRIAQAGGSTRAGLRTTQAGFQPAPGTLLVTHASGNDYYWEYIASQPAGRLLNYSYVASTTGDSIPGSNPRTAFMIQARTAEGQEWWFSNPDSGYSVDNLAPALPQGFSGSPSGPLGIRLSWLPSREADFLEYRLYRGASADFVPEDANLIAARPDTGFFDAAGSALHYYKLAAVDVHGNASRFAVLTPQGPVSVLASLVEALAHPDRVRLVWVASGNPGVLAKVYRVASGQGWRTLGSIEADALGRIVFEDRDVRIGSRYGYRIGIVDAGEEVLVGETWVSIPGYSLALFGARPNPAPGDQIVIGFGLPMQASGKLELLDIAGRMLDSADLAQYGPGSHTLRLAQGMRIMPGVYLVRLRHGAEQRSVRITVFD